jgi:hypothetical protein
VNPGPHDSQSNYRKIGLISFWKDIRFTGEVNKKSAGSVLKCHWIWVWCYIRHPFVDYLEKSEEVLVGTDWLGHMPMLGIVITGSASVLLRICFAGHLPLLAAPLLGHRPSSFLFLTLPDVGPSR